jgi:hypothetical protein
MACYRGDLGAIHAREPEAGYPSFLKEIYMCETGTLARGPRRGACPRTRGRLPLFSQGDLPVQSRRAVAGASARCMPGNPRPADATNGIAVYRVYSMYNIRMQAVRVGSEEQPAALRYVMPAPKPMGA